MVQHASLHCDTVSAAQIATRPLTFKVQHCSSVALFILQKLRNKKKAK